MVPQLFNLRMFLGSTWQDLQAERRAVRDAILNIQANSELPLVAIGMEDFGPSPTPPLHVCVEKVLRSHVYVGIIGHKYGSRPPEHHESYTELEFLAASGAGIPCFIFLKQPGPQASASPPDEPSDDLQALLSFRDRVSRGRVIQPFQTPDELKASFLNYMPARFQEVFHSLRKWWPAPPGALHHGAWLNHLAGVLTSAQVPALEFILHDAELASPVAVLADVLATPEAARAFLLAFILRAASPEEARRNLIRFADALARDPSFVANKLILDDVIWELSGEAERACRLLFGTYKSEQERVEALFAYLIEHSRPLQQAFGVPGAMLEEVLVARKLPGAAGLVDFLVISQTTVDYRVELIKLLTSNTEAVDLKQLLAYEKQLCDFTEELPRNSGLHGAIELLLDHTLRTRRDQARVSLASHAPLSSATVRASYHILVGQRRDLGELLHRHGYPERVKQQLGVATGCVSYDRFIAAVKAYESDKP